MPYTYRAGSSEVTGSRISGKRRRKLTDAERRKLARRAAKLRRIRKKRSKMKRASGPGMLAVIRLPGGKLKKVRKKFYFNTWDAQGNPTGTLWYLSAKPSREEIDAYRQKYGVKHPFELPIVSDEEMARKRLKPRKRR